MKSAFGAPGDEEEHSPEYVAGRAAMEANNWRTAIRLLPSMALRDTRLCLWQCRGAHESLGEARGVLERKIAEYRSR